MLDYHSEITKKERSSRYIRTALDYLAKQKGDAALEEFLREIKIPRSGSIFQHIYDDENWNSYALEVFIYDRLKDKFDDPYNAIWEFGVASGSGKLDQKDNLFTFKIKIAPVTLLFKKFSEMASKVSLISNTKAVMVKRYWSEGRMWQQANLFFEYVHLPEGFKFPHWSSITAGFGIIYGIVRHRKGLATQMKITHFPNLPSDLPHVNGRKYRYDKSTKNIIEIETGAVVGNSANGPFEVDGIVFNNGTTGIASFQWPSESFFKKLLNATIYRRKLKREEENKILQEKITNELLSEHQQVLSKYQKEVMDKARIIEEKMVEIKALKIQQDGDYYLTSLLTKPLIVNRNKSLTIHTEIFVRQKKKFRFRPHKSDIGGDSCVTDNILLQDRAYTVFVNGDAMGKSMQGAGGALVMGVVFNAYLTRTKYSQHQKGKSPQQWLIDGFLDLQNVFLSFDGSMMISLVMGLVDEETGMLHYINAEHPWLVLFRNGEARFLETKYFLRKIGTPLEMEMIRPESFQMEDGDVIISGSDGRDDIETVSGNEYDRVINEDEFAFLRRIEETGANLRATVIALRRFGKLTDDLSLLKIQFHKDKRVLDEYKIVFSSDAFKYAAKLYDEGKVNESIQTLIELCSENSQNFELHYFLGRRLAKLKRYELAKFYLAACYGRIRGNSDPDYLLAVANKKTGNYLVAIEIGEKVWQNDEKHVNNLVNLADSYRLLGRFSEAKIALKKAQALSSENPNLKRLEKLLQHTEVATSVRGSYPETD